MDIVYKPTFWMVPILNIIKGSLVHHYNQSLCSDVINDLSLEITESLEEFFRKDHNKDTNRMFLAIPYEKDSKDGVSQ